MNRIASILSIVYVVISVLVIAFLVGLGVCDDASIRTLAYLGPGTHAVALTVSLVLMWLLAGGVLLAVRRNWVTRDTLVFAVLFVLFSAFCLSFLREHQAFGDYDAYLQASKEILSGQPFHARYIYPPLWASVLAHVAKAWSFFEVEIACFGVNSLSIIGFFVLGSMLFRVAGLSLNLASVIMFCALLINAPLLRNIVYIQVNFMLLDLILAALLFFPHHWCLSAFCLGVGIHLKVVPIFFVPILAWVGRAKWLCALLFSLLLIFLFTLLNTPASYYGSFVSNLSGWCPTDYRACSIYGFLFHLDRFCGLGWPVKAISNGISVLLLGYVYVLSWLSARRCVFVKTGNEPKDFAVNGSIPAFFIIAVVSPTVWVHHLVMLIIPSLFILLRIRTPVQIVLFVFSWFMLFWMPVFDCYPWSYFRMLGWMVMLVLLHQVILTGKGAPAWIADVERRLKNGLK